MKVFGFYREDAPGVDLAFSTLLPKPIEYILLGDKVLRFREISGYILGPYYPKDINDALEWFAQNLYEFVYKYTDMWFVFQDEWV